MDPPVPDESPGNLRFLINHVFLPPRLPQKDDTTADNDLALVASLYKSLLKFRELEPTASGALSPAIGMVGRFYRKEATTVATIQENICDLADGSKHRTSHHQTLSPQASLLAPLAPRSGSGSRGGQDEARASMGQSAGQRQ